MSENKKYIVYIHTNRINKKRYVGITSQKPDERWRHGEGYKHCVLFYRAIQKYGWDSFDHEIVADNLTQKEAEDMEMFLIAEFNSNCKESGYNISEGGNAPKLTEETKKKISETHLGV